MREIVSPEVPGSAPPVDHPGPAQLDHQPDEGVELSQLDETGLHCLEQETAAAVESAGSFSIQAQPLQELQHIGAGQRLGGTCPQRPLRDR